MTETVEFYVALFMLLWCVAFSINMLMLVLKALGCVPIEDSTLVVFTAINGGIGAVYALARKLGFL